MATKLLSEEQVDAIVNRERRGVPVVEQLHISQPNWAQFRLEDKTLLVVHRRTGEGFIQRLDGRIARRWPAVR